MRAKYNVVLGVTGSVACTLVPKLVAKILEFADVYIIPTEAVSIFINLWEKCDEMWIDGCDNSAYIYAVQQQSYKKGDSVYHIYLRDISDCVVIAPATANTLAKMAYGLADNLLTDTVRALQPFKPMIVAPAMNTQMLENPLTDIHIHRIRDVYNTFIVNPQQKKLACGEVGNGAMAELDDIVQWVKYLTLWHMPIDLSYYHELEYQIPVDDHPGAFGSKRKHDIHTGVDLYCENNQPVYACKGGKVVSIGDFTGKNCGTDWWEDTKYMMVDSGSYVINYGEIEPHDHLAVGSIIKAGEFIGRVKRVLPLNKLRKDIPNHSCSMLHIELYKAGTTKPVEWKLGTFKPEELLDPTPYLQDVEVCNLKKK